MRKKTYDERQLALFAEVAPQVEAEKPPRVTPKQLKEELERERMRLAVVGVVANGGSVEWIQPEYHSDSLRAVVSLQEELERLRSIPADWQTLHRRCQLAEAEVDRLMRVIQAASTTPPLHEVVREYFAGPRTQRFGQFFINRYFPKDEAWPELFYETDLGRALELVAAWYVAREAE